MNMTAKDRQYLGIYLPLKMNDGQMKDLKNKGYVGGRNTDRPGGQKGIYEFW